MYRSTLIICLILLPWPVLALVNINTATLAELDTLPGVGPATAQKIIDARPFNSTSQIQNISGIGGPGSATYDNIINLITVDGQTTVVVETKATSTASAGGSIVTPREPEARPKPVETLIVSSPSQGFIGESVEFRVKPAEGELNRLVRYDWNFGDGTTASGQDLSHIYQHAGTYVVVVESYYLKERQLARVQITILPPKVTIKQTVEGLSLTNRSDYEINLSGMKLVATNWQFTFPEHSWLLPDSSLIIDGSSGVTSALLYSPEGRLVSSGGESTIVRPTPRISAVSAPVTRVVDQSPTTTGEDLTIVGAAKPSPGENLVAAASAESSSKLWPYQALMMVIGLGLLALYKESRKLA